VIRRSILVGVLLTTAVGLPVAPATGAAGPPTLTLVSPMRVKAGMTLRIHGHHFDARRAHNTVIFRAPSGRLVFVKPRSASRTLLVVRVPGAVRGILSTRGGQPVPTRFRLRVLAGRLGPLTVRRLSPVIVPSP
jgi:hypothetical protein